MQIIKDKEQGDAYNEVEIVWLIIDSIWHKVISRTQFVNT